MSAVPLAAPADQRDRTEIPDAVAALPVWPSMQTLQQAFTMGFTALHGLPMGTRCGTLDPGVVLHLLREKKMSADGVERLLYQECGLRGLSGLSNDVRDLLASRESGAKLALDYFVYHASRQLGALAAVLGGVDGVVFTGGIGEHSPEIRAQICNGAAWLGVRLDEAANRFGGPRITTAGSPVSAWVVPTDEEITIARHTLALVRRFTR